MSLSTHVLDATSGKPAAGVGVLLESFRDGGWAEVATGLTDDDGRLKEWLPSELPGVGMHRLLFDTGAYFTRAGVDSTLRVYDGEEHAFGPQWDLAMRRTVRFLDSNV